MSKRWFLALPSAGHAPTMDSVKSTFPSFETASASAQTGRHRLGFALHAFHGGFARRKDGSSRANVAFVRLWNASVRMQSEIHRCSGECASERCAPAVLQMQGQRFDSGSPGQETRFHRADIETPSDQDETAAFDSETQNYENEFQK
jgi:hypothetical protein